MKLRKMTVAAVAIAAALTMTACGSDETETTAATTTAKTTTATTTTEEAEIVLPTAAELNQLLVIGLDETVPLADRVALVEGAEADPELINQVVAAAKSSNAQVEILDPVTDTGSGTAAASLNIIINGQPLGEGAQATFVNVDGDWKLGKSTACQLVMMSGLTSAACAA